MNLNTIANEVIAGLIISLIVTLTTFIFKILKKSYKKNSSLLLIKVNFYSGLVGTILSVVGINLENKSVPVWFFVFTFIINIYFLISSFYKAINNNRNNNS